MPKTTRPYSLKKDQKYGTYYYSLLPGSGLPERYLEKRRSTGKTRRDDAEAYVLRRIDELRAAASREEHRPGAIRFREWAADFYTDRCPHLSRVGIEVSPKTLSVYRTIVERRILTDEIADMLLDEISPADIIAYRERLLSSPALRGPGKLTRATVRGYMERLRTILHEAVAQGLLSENPAARVPRLQIKQRRGRLSLDEITEILRRAHWQSEAAWLATAVAAMTGMRESEITALHWSQLTDRQSIVVDRAWKGRSVMDEPKTGSRREIPIAPTLWALLEGWGATRDRSGLVFTSPHGDEATLRRYAGDWPGQPLRRVMSRLEISRVDETGKRSLHSLRHSLASMLIEIGVSAALVQFYFGWSAKGVNSVLTATQALYTHIHVDALRPVSDAIESIFSEALIEHRQ